jgi:hypothetical protein
MHDNDTLEELFPSLSRSIGWIEKRRLRNTVDADKPYYGLLPPGLSAEHLGLADNYFWDNAWSLAGVEAFRRICRMLGREREIERTTRLLQEYRNDIETAIQRVQRKFNLKEIPASPNRGVDCGMIGSCCFWYPLQLLPPDDSRMMATLDTLVDRFNVKGMFFQDFVHSGMNPYLTLQIAQAWLYGGDREKFWELLTTVLSHTTPTLNFPEAIHPATGGGSMGDGHHGWASAEILHSFRDAFVQERWKTGDEPHDLVLCPGIPSEWFRQDASFAVRNAPIPEGMISIEAESGPRETTMRIAFDPKGRTLPARWILRLPIEPVKVLIDGREQPFKGANELEIDIPLKPGSATLRIIRDSA